MWTETVGIMNPYGAITVDINPHKLCPSCDGAGKVHPFGFTRCKLCKGKGLVDFNTIQLTDEELELVIFGLSVACGDYTINDAEREPYDKLLQKLELK